MHRNLARIVGTIRQGLNMNIIGRSFIFVSMGAGLIALLVRSESGSGLFATFVLQGDPALWSHARLVPQ